MQLRVERDRRRAHRHHRAQRRRAVRPQGPQQAGRRAVAGRADRARPRTDRRRRRARRRLHRRVVLPQRRTTWRRRARSPAPPAATPRWSSKIERAEAIENLAEIVDASDVVMVARGDLGVEIGDAELPGLQKKIIRESLERNRVVITATQMLQSMVDSPIPTRAEVLDVANAVIDGTDAVMLSQESAAGSYPVKAVEAMARICLGAERQFEPRHRFRGGAAQPRARRPGDRDGGDVPVRAHRRARDHRDDRIRRHRALPVALPLAGADLRPVAPRRRAPAHGDDARRVPASTSTAAAWPRARPRAARSSSCSTPACWASATA